MLHSFGADRSILKDMATQFMANLAAAGHMPMADEVLKNTFANHAFENFEIASYKSLIVMAEASGNQKFIPGLQETLREIVQVVVIFDYPTIAEMAAYLIDQHPKAVERLFGIGSGRRQEAAALAGDAELAEFRSLIRPLPPPPRALRAKNPPAVFVLSPPRSGSTLMRVMLGGHPRLFSPPELELLSFNTLRERRAAFTGRDAEGGGEVALAGAWGTNRILPDIRVVR